MVLTEREKLTVKIPAPMPVAAVTEVDQDDGDSESGDLLDEVDALLGEEATDEEDAPDWNFDAGEVRVKDPKYTFCPAVHRRQLLRMFTKHFCQHPIFPERGGIGTLTRDQIRQNAVAEMYQFCRQRGLTEVWGYMWASWYAPKIWKIWARSSADHLSRLRTTMGVENFWRQLKHDFLHHYHRPRLDLLVWVLINNVTPAYVARAEVLEDGHRLGRSNKMTTFQTAFKAAWKKLAAKPLGTREYNVDLATWTCDCGSQKYHAQHLCKHLVHAAGPPDKKVWRQIARRRTRPLYKHPHLIGGDYEDADNGTITDGDDHVWNGDERLLSGGRWREIGASEKILGKRARELEDVEDDEVNIGNRLSTPPRSSSPFVGHGADEEDEVRVMLFSLYLLTLMPSQIDQLIAAVETRAAALAEASAILRAQLPHRNAIWLRSMVSSDVGADAHQLVRDVRRYETTGLSRDNTWAKSGDRDAQRRARNTMGYQTRGSRASSGTDSPPPSLVRILVNHCPFVTD